ncbi:hypothetical protein [Pseudonocardia terrae]|nr:hypothetical protein [Pseudonocardia terrae]
MDDLQLTCGDVTAWNDKNLDGWLALAVLHQVDATPSTSTSWRC